MRTEGGYRRILSRAAWRHRGTSRRFLRWRCFRACVGPWLKPPCLCRPVAEAILANWPIRVSASLLLFHQGTHMAAVAFLVSWTRLAIFAYKDDPPWKLLLRSMAGTPLTYAKHMCPLSPEPPLVSEDPRKSNFTNFTKFDARQNQHL